MDRKKLRLIRNSLQFIDDWIEDCSELNTFEGEECKQFLRELLNKQESIAKDLANATKGG